jgi:hypothetical protein
MATQEILIMAMTYMRAGICTAGFINEPHRLSQLRWVRPVKEFGCLLLGDMTDAKGRVVKVGDVIELNLRQPRPQAVHGEDWVADFIKERPRFVRQLTDQKRADFLTQHCDQSPADVLGNHTRSLCLIHPQAIWANFSLDLYSGKYEARIGFQLDNQWYPESNPQRGLPVTDLKWRALGRSWLKQAQRERLMLDQIALLARLPAEAVYLSIGLSRPFEGKIWPLVIGVHPIPDYNIWIDYHQT